MDGRAGLQSLLISLNSQFHRLSKFHVNLNWVTLVDVCTFDFLPLKIVFV